VEWHTRAVDAGPKGEIKDALREDFVLEGGVHDDRLPLAIERDIGQFAAVEDAVGIEAPSSGR
jgi:hypothetical protein